MKLISFPIMIEFNAFRTMNTKQMYMKIYLQSFLVF